MAARLGNVLYWTAVLLALGWLILISYLASIAETGGQTLFWLIGVGGAAIIWLIGRAFRYILSAI